jgi:Predicted transcriptional regulators
MDIQLKRGLLEICVLAVLEKGDSYGYKMLHDLADVIDISESTLYPILKRLETGGSLVVYSIEHNSRLRKYYKITETGTRRVSEFIIDWGMVEDAYKFIKENHCQ